MRRRRWRRKSLKLRIFLICFLMVFSLWLINRQITPIITEIATREMHTNIVRSVNQASREQLAQEDFQSYQDLMYIERDNAGKIVLMVPETMRINRLVADITLRAEEELRRAASEAISIPLGAISNNALLARMGPRISVRTEVASALDSKLGDDFISAGINQTRHRIWLDISAEMVTVIPFRHSIYPVETRILLTEGIIVGPIPNTYLDLGSLGLKIEGT